jgi:Fe-S oxidoreductase
MEERFSDLRLKQASGVGAEVLVTSCPYCITNFEESRLNLEYDDVLEIKDLTEIILAATLPQGCINNMAKDN